MLLGSTTLDVVIGLIFVYLAVSLVCSALNEVIEMRLRNRSKDLERGIRELLTNTVPASGTTDAKGVDIVQKLYDHPIISGLFQGNYATATVKRRLPSYIPSRNFALALMDLAGLSAAGAASLRETAMAFAATNEKVSKTMVTLLDAAGNDANRLRQNLEEWFDSSMDRVSGWYKRRTQYIIFSLGMILAAVANVDSVAIVRTLSTDSGVRDALIAQAKEYAAGHQPAAGGAAAPAPPETAQASLDRSVETLRHLGLPLGWDGLGPIGPYGWTMKFLGIFMTGLAVSLGAPFWFDLLNKFIVVRSTVKPTEKSRPEKPKE
jgi:hypothetical protein